MIGEQLMEFGIGRETEVLKGNLVKHKSSMIQFIFRRLRVFFSLFSWRCIDADIAQNLTSSLRSKFMAIFTQNVAAWAGLLCNSQSSWLYQQQMGFAIGHCAWDVMSQFYDFSFLLFMCLLPCHLSNGFGDPIYSHFTCWIPGLMP
jgi:hypothetical protein